MDNIADAITPQTTSDVYSRFETRWYSWIEKMDVAPLFSNSLKKHKHFKIIQYFW